MEPSRQQAGLGSRTCICGSTYTPYRVWQRACSKKCNKLVPPDPTHLVESEFTCRECSTTFRAATAGGGGQFLYCDGCKPLAVQRNKDSKNAARLVANNPNRAARNRRELLKSRYGLTPEQYDEMLAAQDGACALCAEKPKPGGIKAASKLHVDHDHETGKIRALLCNRCNQGLGYFRDDTALMQRASLYVWKHRLKDD